MSFNDPRHALLSKASSDKGRLQRAALALLDEHERLGLLPTSLRFLFYELEGRGEIAKSKPGERRADTYLSEAVMHLRKTGLVPWEWIVDETRKLTQWRYAPSVADYLADSLDAARIDCWDGAPPPLIVCESRTFDGVLRRTVAPEYLAPVCATNGQVGGFLHTDVVPILAGNERPVLYVGDLDEHGALIEANTRSVLARATGDRSWTRVALTEQQAAEFDLRPITKPTGKRAFEVEQLGQGEVTALVREALDSLLPQPLAGVREREERERAEWMRKLRRAS